MTANKYIYTHEQDIFKLADIYAKDIAQNHAFTGANKHMAFFTTAIFLLDNGYEAPPTLVGGFKPICRK